MDFLLPFLKVIHFIVSVFLIFVILLQPGKGGDLGSVFGGGTSESVFGASGAVPFLAKLTRLFAAIFIITSLTLGYFSVKSISSSVIMDTDQEQTVVEEPVQPIEDSFEEEIPDPSSDIEVENVPRVQELEPVQSGDSEQGSRN